MTYDAPRIAAAILANAEAMSVLSPLDPVALRVRLWHMVAHIATTEYIDMPPGAPLPNIGALTDSVLDILIGDLK